MSKYELYVEYNTPLGDTGVIVDIDYDEDTRQDVYTIEFSERETDIIKCTIEELPKLLLDKHIK